MGLIACHLRFAKKGCDKRVVYAQHKSADFREGLSKFDQCCIGVSVASLHVTTSTFAMPCKHAAATDNEAPTGPSQPTLHSLWLRVSGCRGWSC